MANKYTVKFSSAFGKAQFENDKTKAQAALGENWDTELAKYQAVTNKIEAELDKVYEAAKKINTDNDSGKEAQRASNRIMNEVKQLKNNLTVALNKLSNALTQEQNAEYKRMSAWVKKQMEAEGKGISEM